MKKGKVFSKRHIVLASMVLCLAAAVWLNMKYSSFDNLNVSSLFFIKEKAPIEMKMIVATIKCLDNLLDESIKKEYNI